MITRRGGMGELGEQSEHVSNKLKAVNESDYGLICR
jgi:hypothetical protein